MLKPFFASQKKFDLGSSPKIGQTRVISNSRKKYLKNKLGPLWSKISVVIHYNLYLIFLDILRPSNLSAAKGFHIVRNPEETAINLGDVWTGLEWTVMKTQVDSSL